MIRVRVRDSHFDGFHQWWVNFMDFYRYKYAIGTNDGISKALAEWQGINVVNTLYIEFPSEEDVTLFLLRWS